MIRTQDRAESLWESLNVDAGPAAQPVALGGNLEPATVLAAYRRGLYPFPVDTVEAAIVNELTYDADVQARRIHIVPGRDDPFTLSWWSPDPRPVIRVDQARIQRSLRQQLRNRADWTTTADTCFAEVVRRCRVGRAQRWLTDDLMRSLSLLHEQGHAHSVEVWDRDELIGGVFGITVGAVFSADSQFTLRSGAGKTAVADLTRRFAEAGGAAVDVQRESDHARLLGASPIPRSRYLDLLALPTDPQPLDTRKLPARRLTE